MANYTGFLNMLVWVEAETKEQADEKIDLMLDAWDKATPEAITWDSVNWRLEEEKEPEQ